MLRRLALALALAFACAGLVRAQDKAESVSLVALLANPSAFEGRHVIVQGYLNIEFEGDMLYLSKSDFDANVISNSVWVDTPLWRDKAAARRLSRRYARVDAVFTTRGRYFRECAGQLTQVKLIAPLYSRADFEHGLDWFPWSATILPLGLLSLFVGGLAWGLFRRRQS